MKENGQGTKTAAVLLSCWNGEKYLRTQIESILSQSYRPLELYIRDDCSADGTAEILREAERAYANVHVDYGTENLGYPACFYALTDREDIGADYYFFSDQDDKWYPEKISRAVSVMEAREGSGPLAYFTGYDLCDGELNKVRTVVPARFGKQVGLRETLYEVCGLEFTMGINREAFELLKEYRPRRSAARGTWMNMLYSALGTIILDDRPAAAYRRNESSVTNRGTSRGALWKWRTAHFRKQDLAEYRSMLREFEEIAGPKLTEKDVRTLRLFASGRYLPDAFRKAFWPHRLRSGAAEEAALRLMFLLGRL